MNELRMNGFEALAMDEMMTVDGGGRGHDGANLLASAGTFIGSTAVVATAETAAIAAGVTVASGLLLLGGAIYYNYKYAPRSYSTRHHR